MINLLIENPLFFVILAVVMVFSLSIHELSHALVADRLGDSTARLLGRITLNPVKHLDPLGTLALFLFGFGWGKPVPFNSLNLKNPRRDAALISLAGPGSNLLLALVLALLIHLLGQNSFPGQMLYLVVYYNVVIGIFNLLPFGPLDGFKIVYGFLPVGLAMQWAEMEKYGLFILMFLIFTQSTSSILSPLINIFLRLLGL